jgi:catechol 2,3-dioxygenase-like lactoylglutathione lyase family enzyme
MTRLHHTGYTVDDLDRSLAFYRDLLGMQVVAQQEKAGGYLAAIVGYSDAHVRMAHLRLGGDEHVLELFEYLAPKGRAAPPLQPCDTGTPHLCFAVDDLEALYARLLIAGVDTFVSAPVEVDTGVNRGGRALYLRDPDGIPVELFQPATGGST